MQNYDLVIASDHAGYQLKQKILKHFESKHSNMHVLDLGTDNDNRTDYPDYAKLVTDMIINEESPKGILICGTGIGMSIAANRNSQVYAALCTDILMAEKARQHNNANVLVLGSRIVETKIALKIVDTFLSAEFEGGRHASRLNKIS